MVLHLTLVGDITLSVNDQWSAITALSLEQRLMVFSSVDLGFKDRDMVKPPKDCYRRLITALM